MRTWVHRITRAASHRSVMAIGLAMLAVLLAPAAARVLWSVAMPSHRVPVGLAIAADPICGNGIVESGEQCDDGNNADGDCCSWDCQFEPADSYCDDGNACDDPDACDGHGHCVGLPPLDICPGDQCHDPIACDPQTGCNNPAKPDGTPCDDGDACSGDQCVSGVCIGNVPTCGDGVIESSCEYCDDGNTASGDGCNAGCKMEQPALKCQHSIAVTGVWQLKVLQKIQRCREALNNGRPPIYYDRLRTVPLTDPADCRNEYTAALFASRMGSSGRKKVSNSCTDGLTRALPMCAETVDGLVNEAGDAGCLIETHAAAVGALLAQEYVRALSPQDDLSLRKCQKAVGMAGNHFATNALHAIQVCRDKMDRGKPVYLDDAQQQRLTDPADCASASTTHDQIVKAGKSARNMLTAGTTPACTDDLLSTLELCATTVDALVSPDGSGGCLLAGHMTQVEAMIQAEYRAR